MQKILIIEDEPSILLGLKDELSQNYQIFTADCGNQGLKLAKENQPGLILLDIVLPDLDGFQVCQKLKEEGVDSSIIMLTAKDQIVDKVKGLELGADDYITKPFSLDELKARIKAVLRRKELLPATEYKDDILDIDFRKNKVFRKKKAVNLSYLELKLLRFLISQGEKTVTRKELLEHVWGYQALSSTRTVDTHIGSLRKKIGKKYIQTIHGVGYKFIP